MTSSRLLKNGSFAQNPFELARLVAESATLTYLAIISKAGRNAKPFPVDHLTAEFLPLIFKPCDLRKMAAQSALISRTQHITLGILVSAVALRDTSIWGGRFQSG